MERIQSAIAKARAERRAMQEGGAPALPAAEGAPAAAPDPAGAGARWEALAAFVPDPARLAAQRVVTARGGHEALPFDQMRTRVLQQMRANGWKRLAVTSATAACGKTTVALNLAFGLARQPDLRTILCEVDLRRPAMTAALGLSDAPSFARVLEGRSAFAEEARRIGGNLAVAPTRHPARNPAELLHGPGVAGVLDAIEADYAPDLMIFDTAPLMASDDTMAFLGHVDAALLVAAAEATTIAQIDHCEKELAAHTSVMGVILNKCRYPGRDSGYGYSYG